MDDKKLVENQKKTESRESDRMRLNEVMMCFAHWWNTPTCCLAMTVPCYAQYLTATRSTSNKFCLSKDQAILACMFGPISAYFQSLGLDYDHESLAPLLYGCETVLFYPCVVGRNLQHVSPKP
jgi:hypothetical protein